MVLSYHDYVLKIQPLLGNSTNRAWGKPLALAASLFYCRTMPKWEKRTDIIAIHRYFNIPDGYYPFVTYRIKSFLIGPDKPAPVNTTTIHKDSRLDRIKVVYVLCQCLIQHLTWSLDL